MERANPSRRLRRPGEGSYKLPVVDECIEKIPLVSPEERVFSILSENLDQKIIVAA